MARLVNREFLNSLLNMTEGVRKIQVYLGHAPEKHRNSTQEGLAMEPQMEIDGSIDPEPSQPRMFGGYVGSARLPWGWATERLSRARTYWIATTRPTGQPHSRPVWGVCLDNTFYFSTGSLAAQNLASQPAITVHLAWGNEVVILEGVTHQCRDVYLLHQVLTPYHHQSRLDLAPNP